MLELKIPDFADKVLQMLKNGGFEAYFVGGCVRDSVLGRIPHDWDICTDARPDEMKNVFEGLHTEEIGIRHGTLTVFSDNKPVEVTTYRCDGEYSDHRSPDKVSFVSDLKSDIMRRDFTVNAMCYDPKNGLTDIVGGEEDAKNGIIRCVGEPSLRFEEDALRIMRALRFSAVLGFEIEKNTCAAMWEKKHLLEYISAQRIFSELSGLLCGAYAADVLREYGGIIAVIIPEISRCFGFEQHNPHHMYDVWTHICKSVEICRPERDIRLTMLLHDIAKPLCAVMDENGTGHFKGHQQMGAELAYGILKRLCCPNDVTERVCGLIREHDDRIPVERGAVKRFIAKYGYDFFMDYLEVRRADTYAQSEYLREEKLRDLDSLAAIAIRLEEENACLTTAQLAVGGEDMLSLGLSGKAVGEALRGALGAVISEEIKNEREEILRYVKDNFL